MNRSTCDAGNTETGRPPPSTTAIPGNRRLTINRAAFSAGSPGPTVGRSCARSRALTPYRTPNEVHNEYLNEQFAA
jgi:hypothetical protein